MGEGAAPSGLLIVEEALVLRPRTVKELVRVCRSKSPGVSEQELLESVRVLSDGGRIVLGRPRFESFGRFLLNPFWNTSLIAVLVLSVTSSLLYFVASTFPWSLFQIVPGLPLVFYFPGHSLLRILLGQRPDNPLERIVLEIAASIVIVMLLGLLLNFSSLGLFSAAALGSVVIFNLLFALWVSYEDFSTAWLRK